MQRYTIVELSDAATYAADPELATLARRVASASPLDLPTGERKRLALVGGMAEAVYAAVLAHHTEADEAARVREEHSQTAHGLSLPPGWSLNIAGEIIELTGPRDETMQASLTRHGKWMAKANRWEVPLAKAATLARSLQRQAKAAPARAQAARRAKVEQWLGYVEEKAATGYLYERGIKECHANGVKEHADLDARLTAAVAQAERVQAQQRANRDQARQAERAQRQARQDAESAARGPRLRHLYPTSEAPCIGAPVKGLDGKPVVYTGPGRSFPIHADHPSLHGSHLLGHEGRPGAYFYYREATVDEIAQLEAGLAAEAEAAGAAAARRADVQALAADVRAMGEQLAENVAPPQGRIVSDTRELGVGTALVVAEDAVYCIEGFNDCWDVVGTTGARYWRSTAPEIRQRALAFLGE